MTTHPLDPLWNIMRDVSRSRCAVKHWKFTRAQAHDMASWLSTCTNDRRPVGVIFDDIVAGRMRMLGASVQVIA